MVNLYSRVYYDKKEKLQFLCTALLGQSEDLCGSLRLYPACLSPGTAWHQLWDGFEPVDWHQPPFPTGITTPALLLISFF